MRRMMLVLALMVLSSAVFAQAPDVTPPQNPMVPGKMEEMPSNLPFTVQPLRTDKSPNAPPDSADEAGWLATEAAFTAHKLQFIAEKIDDVNRRGQDLALHMKTHNDQWPGGSCEYPPDNPHACDGWIREGQDQNTQMTQLKNEYVYLVGMRGMLRTHQSITLARLRLGAFLGQLSAWKQRVVGCTTKPSDEAVHRCLVDAWEAHP